MTTPQRFDLPVRTGARVVDVGWDDGSFTVTLAGGDRVAARALIGASGGFGRPVLPSLAGAGQYTGRLLHAADYRGPEPYLGQRVVVVGAGNTAVQVAVDLAGVAEVTLATRRPLALAPQRPLGVDVHYWTRWSGLETLPLGRRGTSTARVLDDGRYAAALAAGRPDRRPMFTRLTAQGVQWADGTLEDVDVVILATGYRPDMDYLDRTAALDSSRVAGALPGSEPDRAPARVCRPARANRVRISHRSRRWRRRPPGRPAPDPCSAQRHPDPGDLPGAGPGRPVS